MQVHTVQPNGWLHYAIPIVIAAVVLGLRARRMTQMRPLKLERLWIVPALYLAIVAATFIAQPPDASGWGISVVTLFVGAALGWQRGKTMQIHVDPETHALNQKSSIVGIAFLAALVLVKSAANAEGSALHLNLALVTDTLMTLALGMFTAMRVEMYLRATRLLQEARAGRA